MPVHDISLVPDSEMRPWAECKETDAQVEVELSRVNEILNFTSPMKNAGFAGYSELDEESQEFKDFKDMVDIPG